MKLHELHDFAIDIALKHLIKTRGVTGIDSHRSAGTFPWCAYLCDGESLDELAGDKHLFVRYGNTKNAAERRVCAAIVAQFIVRHCGARRVTIAWDDANDDTSTRGAT